MAQINDTPSQAQVFKSAGSERLTRFDLYGLTASMIVLCRVHKPLSRFKEAGEQPPSAHAPQRSLISLQNLTMGRVVPYYACSSISWANIPRPCSRCTICPTFASRSGHARVRGTRLEYRTRAGPVAPYCSCHALPKNRPLRPNLPKLRVSGFDRGAETSACDYGRTAFVVMARDNFSRLCLAARNSCCWRRLGIASSAILGSARMLLAVVEIRVRSRGGAFDELA